MSVTMKPGEEVTVIHHDDGTMSLQTGTVNIPIVGSHTISGDLRSDGNMNLVASYSAASNWTLNGGGSSHVGYMTPDPSPLVLALQQLTAAVKAGAPCRCAPTEVCPECHDLRKALEGAEAALKPYTSETLTLEDYVGLRARGVTHVPAGALTVATSGTTSTSILSGDTNVG